jgi:hypothetical protein
MKKYILVVGAALLTTAAVTATVLSNGKPAVKKEVKCSKMDKKAHCPKMDRTHCFD